MIIGLKRFADREVVLDLCRDRLRYGDQSVFFKLGLFDVEGSVISAIMLLHESYGFRDPHAAPGQEQYGEVHGQIAQKERFPSADSFAKGCQ